MRTQGVEISMCPGKRNGVFNNKRNARIITKNDDRDLYSCICIIGNLLSATGTIFQKKLIDRSPGQQWWKQHHDPGVTMVVLASVLDFVALYFAGVYIVSCCQ